MSTLTNVSESSGINLQDNSNSHNAQIACSEIHSTQDTSEMLHSRQVRTVYLITYSQANLDQVPKREHFAHLVVQAFDSTCNIDNIITQWACSLESHQNGGYHYHMAIKLKQARRWISVRRWLHNRHGISVNFSNIHSNYYSAWKYTTKQDKDYVQSHDHPDLTSTKAITVRGKNKKGKGQKRLSVYDVSQLAVKKGIKTRLGLVALANEQKKAGKEDLAQFIANRGPKVVAEALSVGWELEEAEGKIARQRLTRFQILERCLEEDCAEGCNGEWLNMAETVLTNNGVTCASFSTIVKELLDKGRGKYRNVMITGPANCGKTFLLNPLNHVYKTFTNPATTSFAWVGSEDFRWSPQVLPWHNMLLLLEGQTVHLPAPKSHFSKDITFNTDTPIFCTGKQEIILVKGGNIDERESEMMRVRWHVFRFNYQIPESEQRDIAPCKHCFAELILRPCLL